MKLFIWHISDAVVEQGIAFAIAPTKEEAISAICEEVTDPEMNEELRAELEESEPAIATSEVHGEFFISST